MLMFSDVFRLKKYLFEVKINKTQKKVHFEH